MNKRFKFLYTLAMITLFLTSCGAWAWMAQSQKQATPDTVRYQSLLGQRINAKDVIDLMTSNNFTPSAQSLANVTYNMLHDPYGSQTFPKMVNQPNTLITGQVTKG